MVTVACSRRLYNERWGRGWPERREYRTIRLKQVVFTSVCFFLTSELENEILKWLQFLFLVCRFVVVFIALRFFGIFFGYFGLFS